MVMPNDVQRIAPLCLFATNPNQDFEKFCIEYTDIFMSNMRMQIAIAEGFMAGSMLLPDPYITARYFAFSYIHDTVLSQEQKDTLASRVKLAAELMDDNEFLNG